MMLESFNTSWICQKDSATIVWSKPHTDFIHRSYQKTKALGES